MSSSNVGMIYIRRERRFIGSAMSFQVFIDGIPVGTITNGQEVVFQLQQGRRAVQLKTHWKRLEKLMIIEAKPGETIYLKCRARFKDIELYYDNILNRSEQPTSTSETQREHTYNTLDLQIVREDNIV